MLGTLGAKTLPNGIRQERAGDNATRLPTLTCKRNDNSPIESDTCVYDTKGQRPPKQYWRQRLNHRNRLHWGS